MKFKVGDWVRSTDGLDISIVTKDTIRFYKEGFNEDLDDSWELWKPKEGEWCWLYNDRIKLDNIGILRRFTQMEKDIDGNDMFCCEPTLSDKEELEHIKVYYKYCEPFIGLPTYLKDDK